ncbi:MAG: glycolate oxidase subunit GlcD [Candidatus Brocadia sp.]|nr:putative FAD-linked oxidoreductase [Candidatus Brocadia fulgida]MCC6324378.1 FAD-binding protein [Candidatus Brocadia sp.]MCE7911528.1 FAD-binding protein [Candidatus Brocadia sp. AMX3]MDG5995637.1 FAD-binding protein [Candidatus Brocadia sp.]RIK01177.1 MAG: glycolate oxidase subunit GlcD [Candidatus Brocadia sp.]
MDTVAGKKLTTDGLSRELSRLVGKKNVLSALEDRICYSCDGSKQRCVPDIVVRPQSAQDVSATVQFAHENDIPVYPRGAGSGLTGGAVPVKGGIVLDFTQMNHIVEISPEDLTATVEPGVVTQTLQNEVAKHKLFYPPDPASAPFSTIGGNVAECSGGITGLKYGVTRDYILSLEVVLANGSVIHTGRKTLKSVTGYDLTRLFVGSEGTLGVFTRITVKLLPLPEKIETLLVFFATTQDAVQSASQIIFNNLLPRAMEFIDKSSITCIQGYRQEMQIPAEVNALLLIDIDGKEASVKAEASLIEEIVRKNHAIRVASAKNGQERDVLWEVRRAISPALYNIAPYKINEDICVPRSRILEILDRIANIHNRYPSLKVACFGHIGDGNIHVNVMYDKGDQQKTFAERMIEEILRNTVEVGGTISGEHGIGNMKSAFLSYEIPPMELEIMKDIKRLLDPKGILNPGKMFSC